MQRNLDLEGSTALTGLDVLSDLAERPRPLGVLRLLQWDTTCLPFQGRTNELTVRCMGGGYLSTCLGSGIEKQAGGTRLALMALWLPMMAPILIPRSWGTNLYEPAAAYLRLPEELPVQSMKSKLYSTIYNNGSATCMVTNALIDRES